MESHLRCPDRRAHLSERGGNVEGDNDHSAATPPRLHRRLEALHGLRHPEDGLAADRARTEALERRIGLLEREDLDLGPNGDARCER
jgi:hypothetical protein